MQWFKARSCAAAVRVPPLFGFEAGPPACCRLTHSERPKPATSRRSGLRAFRPGWGILALPLLTALTVLVGCRTASKAPLFTATGPGWRVQEGQALWRPWRQSPELGGELTLASHADGRCVIQFAKTPLPLVLAQTTRTNWFIEFAPRQKGFAGPQPPPVRFAWLYLPAALAGQSLPSVLRFQHKPDGGWRLENTRSGETVEGFLAP